MKIELAIMISNIDDLLYVKEPYRIEKINSNYNDYINHLREACKEQLNDLSISRIYFGNEFCEHLIPSLKDIQQVYQLCDNKYKITFITPPVTDFGIRKLTSILDYLSINFLESEVVINDWGVCKFLNENYPNIKCIAGRLLDKSYIEPRIEVGSYKCHFNENGLKYLQQPLVTSLEYQKFLNEMHINMVELDNIPQQMDLLELKKIISSISLSLYIPFGYVMTGRQCMMRMLTLKKENKFQIKYSCKRHCQLYNQLMSKEDKIHNSNVILFRKGNTVFYKNEFFAEYLKSNIFERIIYQPKIPI